MTGSRVGAARAASAVVACLLVACGGTGTDDAGRRSPARSPSPPASLPASPPPPTGGAALACPDLPVSPATFDPSGGTYAVLLTGIDPAGRTISFDVVQWLTGDDAREAYRRDHPDDPEGPPNDYYVVNASPRRTTAPVAHPVEVALVRLLEDSDADLDPGSWDELAGYLDAERSPAGETLSPNVFWLTVAGGAVTGICEQYVP